MRRGKRMRLLGRTSSINVRKVLWTAAEIGLPFEHEADWGTPTASTRTTGFLQLNPNGLVPVWVDELGVLWESNSICRYLAGRHGRSDLLPAEPFARAEVEKWMDWQAGDLNSAWRYAFMALVRRDTDFRDQPQIDRSVAAWNDLMMLLDERLAQTGAFVAGAGFTLADVVVGLSVHRWLHTPIGRPRVPDIDAYVQRLRERPAFRRLAIPDHP
jgi:glutathione S-transferase